MPQFLVHTETKREFQVVKLDKTAGVITLKGPNTEFDEPYDKDRFIANGYTLVTKDAPVASKPKPKPEPDPEPEDDEPPEDDDDTGDD